MHTMTGTGDGGGRMWRTAWWYGSTGAASACTDRAYGPIDARKIYFGR